MSFDKRLIKDINRTELTEMARVILSELEKNENLRLHDFSEGNKFKDRGFDCQFDFKEECSVQSRNEGYGQQARREHGDIKAGEVSEPRNTRSDFLSQRLSRRKRRSNNTVLKDGVPFNSERTVIENVPSIAKDTVTEIVPFSEGDAVLEEKPKSKELVNGEFSEKLSEIICRDTRRYDGPFERY